MMMATCRGTVELDGTACVELEWAINIEIRKNEAVGQTICCRVNAFPREIRDFSRQAASRHRDTRATRGHACPPYKLNTALQSVKPSGSLFLCRSLACQFRPRTCRSASGFRPAH